MTHPIRRGYYSTLALLCFLFPAALPAQTVEGDWYGTLEAMGTHLPLVLHFSEGEGGWSGTLDSPEQRVYGIEMDEVTLEGNQLYFRINTLEATYKGTLSPLGLSGDFSQAGFDFPLDFDRTPPAKSGMKRREQEPTEFPYPRETVSFPSINSEVVLSGEINWPTEGKVDRAVVLVSGAGGQDRNSEAGAEINHRPFLVLADYLARRGIATLRYDDRGIGASSGDYPSANTYDFAEDAAAAFRYLENRPECQDAVLGIIGYDEGGLIGAMVAAEEERLDFLVLLAAQGLPSDSVLITQTRRLQENMGAPQAVVARNMTPLKKAYAYIRSHPEASQAELDAGLIDIYVAAFEALPPPLQRAIRDKEEFARQQLGQMSSRWFRYYLSLDPAPFFSRVTVPTLAVHGETDLELGARENLEAIARHVGSNGNPDLTLVPLPGLNHRFQPSETGFPQEYGLIEETFSPTALRIIAGWINNQKN